MTQLLTISGIDIERFMRAIKRVETSDGINNWPRLEPAYIPAGDAFTIQGRYLTGTGHAWNDIVKSRWQHWGLQSAASWSPWQILYHTAADLGYLDAPYKLHDPILASEWVIRRINHIIAHQSPTSVTDLADAWNSGTCRDTIVPSTYIKKVEEAYDK